MKNSFIMTCSAICLAVGLAQAHGEATTPPTDPQIAMIAVVADSVDIDAGKLAAEKSTDPKVKQFAELMVRDHTSVNKKATALVKKLNVTPEESETSRTLKSNGDKNLEKLRGLSGAEFDKAYVDNEVAYHEAVIKTVNEVLIPNTKNAQLKSLLESAKPIFASHLKHAQGIQASMH